MCSVSASEVLRVRRLLAHHIREVVALIPASPEDTAALTREVVRAIVAEVALASDDADELGRRLTGRMTGASATLAPARDR